MTYNRSSSRSTEELTDVAVGALVREWGVTAEEARAAIERVRQSERNRADADHGYVPYTHGCRCDICREAKRAYVAARRAAGSTRKAEAPCPARR